MRERRGWLFSADKDQHIHWSFRKNIGCTKILFDFVIRLFGPDARPRWYPHEASNAQCSSMVEVVQEQFKGIRENRLPRVGHWFSPRWADSSELVEIFPSSGSDSPQFGLESLYYST